MDTVSVLQLMIQTLQEIQYGNFTKATQIIGKPYEIIVKKKYKWVFTTCQAPSKQPTCIVISELQPCEMNEITDVESEAQKG